MVGVGVGAPWGPKTKNFFQDIAMKIHRHIEDIMAHLGKIKFWGSGPFMRSPPRNFFPRFCK